MTNTTIQTIANEMKATMNTMIEDMATRMQALLDAEYNERVTKSEEFGTRIMELLETIDALKKENEELRASQTVAVDENVKLAVEVIEFNVQEHNDAVNEMANQSLEIAVNAEESLTDAVEEVVLHEELTPVQQAFANDMAAALDDNTELTPEQQEVLNDLNDDWDAHFGKEVTTEPVVAITPNEELVVDELPETLVFPTVDVEAETTEEVDFTQFSGFRDVLEEPTQEEAAPVVEDAFDFSSVDTSTAPQAPEATVEAQPENSGVFDGFTGVMDTEAPKKPQTTPSVPNLVVGGREIAKKGEIKVTVYDVMGTEVNWIGYSRRINSHGSRQVREIALALNSMMQQGNTRQKAMTDEEKANALTGKYTTQMIREWAMEIAVANGIKEIGGDAGAAILVAEVLSGEKNGAALRIRNEAERATMKQVYTEMVANPAYLQETRDTVASYWNQFAYTPSAYAEDNNLDASGREYLGTALIAARALNTMANVQGKRTVCVFPEVGKSFMSKKEFQSKMSFI